MRVYITGAGRSVDPAANAEVLRATPGLLSAIIHEAGGTPRLLDLDAGPAGLFS